MAEILLLDQFSRNIYRRTTAMAYQNDPLAQRLAREGLNAVMTCVCH